MPEQHDEIRDLPFFRELGDELRAAAVRDEERTAIVATAVRRRRRLRLAGAALTVAVVAAAAVVGPGIGGPGSSLDPVASASAALSPRGDVVHLVMTGGPVAGDGTPAPTRPVGEAGNVGVLSRRVESWSAASPARFAQHTTVTARDGRPIGTVRTGDAADGRTWFKEFGTGTVVTVPRRTGDEVAFLAPEADDGAAAVLTPQAPNAGEGVAALLRDGTFTQRGRTTIAGRAVVELVASRVGPPTPEIAVESPTGAPPDDLQIRYFVDAATSEPVRIDRYRRVRLSFGPGVPRADRERIRRADPGWTLFSRLDVERYERLPSGPATDRLFAVPEGPGPELPTVFRGSVRVSRFLDAGRRIPAADLRRALRAKRLHPRIDPARSRAVAAPSGSSRPWVLYRRGTSTCLIAGSRSGLCGTRTGLARTGTAISFTDPQPGDPARGRRDVLVRGIAVDDVTQVVLLDENGDVVDRGRPRANVFELRASSDVELLTLRVTGTRGRVATLRLR